MRVLWLLKKKKKTDLRLDTRLSFLECCRGLDGRSTEVRPAHARAGYPATVRRVDRTSTQTGAVTAAEGPDGAVGALYSRAAGAVDAEAAQDPASGGDDAA